MSSFWVLLVYLSIILSLCLLGYLISGWFLVVGGVLSLAAAIAILLPDSVWEEKEKQ